MPDVRLDQVDRGMPAVRAHRSSTRQAAAAGLGNTQGSGLKRPCHPKPNLFVYSVSLFNTLRVGPWGTGTSSGAAKGISGTQSVRRPLHCSIWQMAASGQKVF